MQNVWLDVMASSEVSFTYDQFKTNESFKWTNDAVVESVNFVQV